MLWYLKHLSGFFFYTLGLSFFVAWVMLRNAVYPQESALWLQTADLPLAFSAVVYGGISLYLSLRPSKALAWMIAGPLALFFGFVLVMNFWN